MSMLTCGLIMATSRKAVRSAARMELKRTRGWRISREVMADCSLRALPTLRPPHNLHEPSHEGAQAGDRPAHDQGVDLPGALVGVDGLGVGHEAAHVVLEEDPVAAQEF